MSKRWETVPISGELFENVDAAMPRDALTALENSYVTEQGGHSRFPGLKQYVDLTDNEIIVNSAPTRQSTLYTWISGRPVPGKPFGGYVGEIPLAIERYLPRAKAYCVTAPRGLWQASIKINGLIRGNVQFAGGSHVGSFDFPKEIDFPVGSRIHFEPSAWDQTIAGVMLAVPLLETGEMTLEVFPGWLEFSPSAGYLLVGHVIDKLSTFEAGAPDAQIYALTAPTADWTLDIQLNQVSVGSATILAGQNAGTWSWAAETVAIAGSRLTMVCPDPADATIAGIMVSIPCTQ